VALLYNKISRRLLLTLIIFWGVACFWIISQTTFTSILITIIGIVSLFLTWYETGPIFLLIFSSFTSAYALYGFYYQFALPFWLIMIAILIIFGYVFVYTEQKIGILGDKRLIYLVLFSLIVLEVFFTLNYYLISPLSKSLIIATISYVFVGFCYTVLAKHTDNSIKTYLIIAGIMIAVILSTSIWGTGI
jgi:hypothetical protein